MAVDISGVILDNKVNCISTIFNLFKNIEFR